MERRSRQPNRPQATPYRGRRRAKSSLTGFVWPVVGVTLLLFCACSSVLFYFRRSKDNGGQVTIPVLQKALNPPAHSFTVALDPGHGGVDSGAVWPIGSTDPQFTEAAINLHVAHRLQTKLVAAGVVVVLTRDSDVDVDLAERVRLGEAQKADLFVSIHHNANDDPSVNGTQVLCAPDQIPLGDLFDAELRRSFGPYHIVDHGVTPADDMAVFHNTVPAVITEAAYVTNDHEVGLLGDDSSGFQEAEANALYTAIMRYKAGEGRPVTPTPEPNAQH